MAIEVFQASFNWNWKSCCIWFPGVVLIIIEKHQLKVFGLNIPLKCIHSFQILSVLLALAGWIRGQHIRFLWCSGAAILIFRAELLIYLGQILLLELFSRRLSLKKLMVHAVPAAIILIGMIEIYKYSTMGNGLRSIRPVICPS